MRTVVGVRFRQAGRVYYFDPGREQLARGQRVIVATAKGTEIGTVILPNTEMAEEKLGGNIKKIVRIANEKDEETDKNNREKEKEAFDICKTKIARHGLEMKLIGAEYTFDRNKLLFYFTADGRVDFRELVKDLAGVFRTRIELRQIGVRDETKICGGIGICGRELCCNSYLSEFAPVSIKMAKEQSLSLNPSKISGVCGRLMCCLKNEELAYEELNSHLPNVGEYVKTPEGLKGEVQSVSVLKQRVRVIVELDKEEKEVRDYDVKELKFKGRSRDKNRDKNRGGKGKHDSDLEKLEQMEKNDGKSKLDD
jgi:cell fate regulator YaaT (PSP1 superfamily)